MFFATVVSSSPASPLIPYELRCQSQTNPEAIQETQAQLSWKLRATSKTTKNQSQSAYRIVAASTQTNLQKSKFDLWDSGKIKSSATFGIRYGGKKLESRSRIWWMVQSWDQDNQATIWSSPAYFAVGLLNQTDWKADWIHGAKPIVNVDSLTHAKWIWIPGVDNQNAPSGTYKFTKSFNAVPGATAKILMTVDNTFVLKINGKQVHKTTDPESWSRVQEINLTPHLKAGKNDIVIEATNETNGYAGLIAAITLTQNNRTEVIQSDSTWQVDSKPSQELGENGIRPWNRVTKNQFVTAPAQYFQKEFTPKPNVTRATAYYTALGIVDLEINGKRVNEDLFTPGWTDYKIRTYYRSVDITKLLKKGENKIQVILGQGWYAGYIAWGAQREHYGDTPMTKIQVEIEYSDGTIETIKTDKSWMVSNGPILDEHFLHGEKYDARITPSNWKPAQIGTYKTSLEAFPGDPVREYQSLPAKSIKKIGDNKYLIDFGQNLSGYTRIHVKEKSGTTITIRHGERLDAKGNLYTDNLRLAQAIDQYTTKSNASETWSPRFTFHGFQYVEVTGLTSKPTKETIKAIAISSDTPEVGKQETSDPMLNQLLSNCWWTQKMNFVDIPTDCPQRDERLGWTGDAQAYIQTAAYFSDVQAFFNKWLVSLDDAQTPDGNFPKVAPVIRGQDDGGPAWADAGVICPMEIYNVYGDKELLARHYPNMKRFIDFCRNRSKADMLPPDKYHIFGDWLSTNANTPNDVITTAYFAASTRLLVLAAKALGHSEDVKTYSALHERIKTAFQKAYVAADGKIHGDTQTGYVLALQFDLLTPDQTKIAEEHLIANIEDRKWHLSTGFVGTRDLMHVLTKIGRTDVAFRLLHNTTFPSWGFEIKNGATSIWERWDGWTPEKGFQDIGMNSFAHYAYGAVAGWMFKTIGGISELEPGYGKVSIAPQIDPNLKFANTIYNSIRGPIKTAWKKAGNKIELTVEIPPNATATVTLPDGKNTTKQVGSGNYNFSFVLPKKKI
ncbi:MAG: family 78 glycoside hydrolase catalytic domain [Fimbriimonadaceae bacterium]